MTENVETWATRWERALREQIMPFWYERTLDKVNGGYTFGTKYHTPLTKLRGAGRRARLMLDGKRTAGHYFAPEKLLVTHTRMVWVYALVHRLGYSDAAHNYLEAAEQGFRFIQKAFLDNVNGGYFWSTTPQGEPKDIRKFLFVQSYMIYALVEYYRASGKPELLGEAREVFTLVQKRMWDHENGGWIEHFAADFSPLPPNWDQPFDNAIARVGLKSCYTNMHWMEALTELYQETGDETVRAALEQVLQINAEMFFRSDPMQNMQFRTPDWEIVTDEGHGGAYPGYDLEFVWLMIRAQSVLGRMPAWDHFDSLLNHAIQYVWDREHGGFYYRGQPFGAVLDSTKVWWVQFEGVAALCETLRARENPEYAETLERLLDWLWNKQMTPSGICVWSTDARGQPLNVITSSNWKEGYHDVRAITQFIRTFSDVKASPIDL